MKHTERIEIAVYGKGGIGKSTVSANLSAAMADQGRKVLQIGCDPKHDSTRLLLHGENITTVLDYLKVTGKEQATPSHILHSGYKGIGCVEAGGPKPGVGCAGRGIISSFEFLERHKVKEKYDTVVYDVLGDVVCGGFAVPVRREYADVIFLVTSGEYMALYAANNILRGIYSYDGDTETRVAGIIYNERRLPDEDGRVQRFAKAVGLPILVKVPRSDAFARAEMEHVTLAELDHCETEKSVFRQLAAKIKPDIQLYHARPLTDERLEEVVLMSHGDGGCGSFSTTQEPTMTHGDGGVLSLTTPKQTTGDGGTVSLPATPSANRAPLYGCAFNGAATCGIHLTDAIIIAHSPRACAFYTWQNISSTGRKNLFNRGIVMPSALAPHFACTDMGQPEAVFGGMDKLRQAVQTALDQKPSAVVVISSCVSGIIGDDLQAVEAMSTPEIPVLTIPADGDIAGDYMEGIRMCMHTLAERLIDKDVKPEGKCINLINETGVSTNHAVNYYYMRDLLGGLGININCRFLGDATVEELRNFKKAPLNILVYDSPDGRELKQWLEDTYDSTFTADPFPVGVEATCRFLEELGEFYHCSDLVPGLIREEREKYKAEIARLRPQLSGKKILITTINANIDYLLETLDDLGMKILGIGVFNYLHQEVKVSNHPEKYPIKDNLSWEELYDEIHGEKPDFMISNYTPPSQEGDYVRDVMPMIPMAGFQGGLDIVRRWAELQKQTQEGGWMNDKELFEQYNR